MGASNYPTQSSTNRPLLAVALLRTGSQMTTTSLANSVAVNFPVTRPTSPVRSPPLPNSTNGAVDGMARYAWAR